MEFPQTIFVDENENVVEIELLRSSCIHPEESQLMFLKVKMGLDVHGPLQQD